MRSCAGSPSTSTGEKVTVPTWRARDVTREIDVVEEVARFRMEDVPFTYPLRREMFGSLTRNQRFQRRVEDISVRVRLLGGRTRPDLVERDPDREALRLLEPYQRRARCAADVAAPGPVDAARRNVELGLERIALFEVARVYLPSGAPLPTERIHVAAIAQGGFARAKGVVEALARALDFEAPFRAAPHDCSTRRGRGAATTGGLVGSASPVAAWRVSGAASSSSSTSSRLPRMNPCSSDDVGAYPRRAPGSCVRRSTSTCRCRPPGAPRGRLPGRSSGKPAS